MADLQALDLANIQETNYLQLCIKFNKEETIKKITNNFYMCNKEAYDYMKYVILTPDRSHLSIYFLKFRNLTVNQIQKLIQYTLFTKNIHCLVYLLVRLVPSMEKELKENTFFIFQTLLFNFYNYPCFFIFLVRSCMVIAYNFTLYRPRHIFSFAILKITRSAKNFPSY